MQVPDLTPKQVDMWQTRLSSHMVRFFLWVLFLNPLHVLIRSGNKRGIMGKEEEAGVHASLSQSKQGAPLFQVIK